MNRTRIMLATYVDLDPIPGTFHTADSARNSVSGILKHSIGHYSPVVGIIGYGREFHRVEFDHNNPNWQSNPEYNILFVKSQLNWLNEKLVAQGYLFLNEVYEALGFPKTREGQIVGWTEGPVSWDPQYNENGTVDIMFHTLGCIIDEAFEADRQFDFTPAKVTE